MRLSVLFLGLAFAMRVHSSGCIQVVPGYFGTQVPKTPFSRFESETVTFRNSCNRKLMVAICFQSPTSESSDTFECSAGRVVNAGGYAMSSSLVRGARWYSKVCDVGDLGCLALMKKVRACNFKPSSCSSKYLN